ncbi:MAG: hypothetical protein AB7N80_03590 [Bdellovibrionales bacterium]
MKFLATLTLTAAMATPNPQIQCRFDQDALQGYEQEILVATQKYATQDHKEFLRKITPPLNCILDIQEKGEGFLKYLANSFLQPLLGGGQISHVPKDVRYQAFANKMRKISEKSPNPLTSSLPAAHARGAWGFYRGFCEPQNQSGCVEFLPPQDLIERQSPLLGASSMMLLRQAYFSTEGEGRNQIANRIRNLYLTTPRDQILKRQVIDKIYRELFPQPDLHTMGSLS